RPLSADWVRKWLHAAREKFAEFLLVEVAGSLREVTLENLEQELIDLDLYQYGKSALDEWRGEERRLCPWYNTGAGPRVLTRLTASTSAEQPGMAEFSSRILVEPG